MKKMRISAISLTTYALLMFSGCTNVFNTNSQKSSTNTQNSPGAVKQVSDAEVQHYLSNLPFKMDEIKVPQFPNKDFNIVDYGAVPDGITKNTAAFIKAIDECSRAGGGRVVVPEGIWLTGPIILQSNVNLYLQSGALIIFSSDREDYSTIGGRAQNPISANNLTNIAITGTGIINGNGDTWRPVKKMKVTESQWKKLLNSGGILSPDGSIWYPTQADVNDDIRPHLLMINNCKSVYIDGPTFQNPPNFTVNLTGCSDVVIRNTKVLNEYYAQNAVGIDITSCQNVVMYNNIVNAGDDGICIKSSGSTIAQNIVIQDCTVYHGHGGFSVGSNTNGGINNVYVHNCNYIGTDAGLRFKSYIGGGGLVHNIFIDGIQMKNILNDAIIFETDYSGRSTAAIENAKKSGSDPAKLANMPQFQDINMSNIVCIGADRAASITGLDFMPVRNLQLKNVVIQAKTGFTATNASDIKMDNVKIMPQKGTIFTLKNCNGITLNKAFCPAGTDNFLSVEGAGTSNIQLTNTDTSEAKNPIKLGEGVNSDAVQTK